MKVLLNKRIFIILILIFSFESFDLFAMCMPGKIEVYPESETININQVILIKGFGTGKKVVEDIQYSTPVYLKSRNITVKLKVIEFNVGDGGTNQIKLKPEKILEPGLEYELLIGNHKIFRRNEQRRYVSTKWKVIITSLEKPIWIESPKIVSKGYYELSCGIEQYIEIGGKLNTEKPVFVEAIVTEINTKKKTKFILLIENHRVNIGQGMCFGEFDFGENRQFELILNLMDDLGNITDRMQQPIRFKSPS